MVLRYRVRVRATVRLRRFLAFRGSARVHSFTVTQEIGGEGGTPFSASEEGKGCSPFSSINYCAPTEVIFCTDLPFMRTALARQGDRGHREVRNPT